MQNLNPVPSIPNLRDLGGLAASPDRLVRSGIVFRGAAPSSAADDLPTVKAALAERGITTTYDLRSESEITRHDQSDDNATAVLQPEVQRHGVPVFKAEDYSPEAIVVRFQDYANEDSVKGFTAAYKGILESGGPAFGAILKHLAADKPAPMLIHCTAGKDRTGVVCAIVLALCGVTDDAIAEEYGLTQEGLKEWRVKAAKVLGSMPSLASNPDGVQRMLSAK